MYPFVVKLLLALALVFHVSPAHPVSTEVGRYSKSDALRVWVYVNGREVGESEGSNCVAYYYARGTTVRLAACGAGPAKIRVVSTRRARVRVRILREP